MDVRGNQVTLATSNAAPITFIADGREKTENSGGRTVRLKATMNGQQLTVSSLGGQTDYTITFVSADNGNTLKVTRRITTDYLRETIFAESVYNKTDQVAQLGIDHGAGNVCQHDRPRTRIPATTRTTAAAIPIPEPDAQPGPHRRIYRTERNDGNRPARKYDRHQGLAKQRPVQNDRAVAR